MAVGLGPVAADQPAPVGDQISVLGGTPIEYPADTPFHVIHGWGIGVDQSLGGAGLLDFHLWLDGGWVEPDFRVIEATPADDGGVSMNRRVLFNFDGGLPAGTYTFYGVWLAPCKFAVADGLYPGPCDRPNQQVNVLDNPLVVTFYE